MKVSFYTLGCKLNFAETSAIGRLFTDKGYTCVEFGEPADVVVINSCTVTAQADKKCRQAIHKAGRISPEALIVVVGCFADLKYGDANGIPGAGLVLGNKDKFAIVEAVQETVFRKQSLCRPRQAAFDPAYSLFDRTRSFLKVQDGCDYHCSYCTIPKVRGHSRNPLISDIVSQANIIASQGIREIVLTGVNVGDFGRSTGESFYRLLCALDSVEGLERIRTGSVEPNLLTDDIIRLIAQSAKLAPHFHLPLQSGCNRILALMARRYRRELFAERVEMIRRHLPLAGIGADVITGFPGETDEDFADSLSFIEHLPLSYLHVFTFSERPGTQAALMSGKVPRRTAEERSKALIALSLRKRHAFYHRHIGQTVSVLFEQKIKSGLMTGFTASYAKVEAPYDASLTGCCTEWRLTGTGASGNLTGEKK
ncbi:MAG: tRNA (N(6)-L-threonylcarbamoyladenosine(37)-C(2))-methylthiotransferase MtaB [Bacteroidales bacterium]|jgi:threonylcarbamoyladenosine tRNA methylthiotransferase MtaB|nr:tRNA (N(6)-L-threonylcarbamoyladenosine(37)-C(2))-methylthiotransferase MtaB [Bacteroidales bacterium]